MSEPENSQSHYPRHKSAPQMVTDVPLETDVFHLQHSLSCHRTDKQQTAAASAAEGEQLPIDAVLYKLRGGACRRIHLKEIHTRHHHRHIISDG